MRSVPITLTLAGLAVLAVAAALAGPATTARAKSPFVTYTSPEDGDVLNGPPPVFQLCFRDPIDLSDTSLQDYRFALAQPGGDLLPLRVYLQDNGYGIVAQAHRPTGDTAGEWTFDWRVRAVGAREMEEGSLKFLVAPEGEPPSRTMPFPCDASGSPASPQPAAGGETTANPDNDDGPDVLLMSLLTVAASAALAVLGFIGYAIRMKTGFWLHRPPAPGDQAGGPEHH